MTRMNNFFHNKANNTMSKFDLATGNMVASARALYDIDEHFKRFFDYFVSGKRATRTYQPESIMNATHLRQHEVERIFQWLAQGGIGQLYPSGTMEFFVHIGELARAVVTYEESIPGTDAMFEPPEIDFYELGVVEGYRRVVEAARSMSHTQLLNWLKHRSEGV